MGKKKFLTRIAASCILLASSVLAAPGDVFDPTGAGAAPPQVLVADLPTCDADAKGSRRVVTDGNSATDCTTGLVSTDVLCECDGSAWAVPTGAGGADQLGADLDRGDIIISGGGTVADLDEAAVEAELEAVIDHDDLQGVPNVIKWDVVVVLGSSDTDGCAQMQAAHDNTANTKIAVVGDGTTWAPSTSEFVDEGSFRHCTHFTRDGITILFGSSLDTDFDSTGVAEPHVLRHWGDAYKSGHIGGMIQGITELITVGDHGTYTLTGGSSAWQQRRPVGLPGQSNGSSTSFTWDWFDGIVRSDLWEMKPLLKGLSAKPDTVGQWWGVTWDNEYPRPRIQVSHGSGVQAYGRFSGKVSPPATRTGRIGFMYGDELGTDYLFDALCANTCTALSDTTEVNIEWLNAEGGHVQAAFVSYRGLKLTMRTEDAGTFASSQLILGAGFSSATGEVCGTDDQADILDDSIINASATCVAVGSEPSKQADIYLFSSKHSHAQHGGLVFGPNATGRVNLNGEISGSCDAGGINCVAWLFHQNATARINPYGAHLEDGVWLPAYPYIVNQEGDSIYHAAYFGADPSNADNTDEIQAAINAASTANHTRPVVSLAGGDFRIGKSGTSFNFFTGLFFGPADDRITIRGRGYRSTRLLPSSAITAGIALLAICSDDSDADEGGGAGPCKDDNGDPVEGVWVEDIGFYDDDPIAHSGAEESHGVYCVKGVTDLRLSRTGTFDVGDEGLDIHEGCTDWLIEDPYSEGTPSDDPRGSAISISGSRGVVMRGELYGGSSTTAQASVVQVSTNGTTHADVSDITIFGTKMIEDSGTNPVVAAFGVYNSALNGPTISNIELIGVIARNDYTSTYSFEITTGGSGNTNRDIRFFGGELQGRVLVQDGTLVVQGTWIHGSNGDGVSVTNGSFEMIAGKISDFPGHAALVGGTNESVTVFSLSKVQVIDNNSDATPESVFEMSDKSDPCGAARFVLDDITLRVSQANDPAATEMVNVGACPGLQVKNSTLDCTDSGGATGCSGHGINGAGTITGNTITKPGSYGINVSGTAGGVVGDNHVDDPPGGSGRCIALNSAEGFIVSRNRMNDCHQACVDELGTADDNTAYGNTCTGVEQDIDVGTAAASGNCTGAGTGASSYCDPSTNITH